MPNSKAKSAKPPAKKKRRSVPDLSVPTSEANKVAGGKRTNVRDANDRYANQDVHY